MESPATSYTLEIRDIRRSPVRRPIQTPRTVIAITHVMKPTAATVATAPDMRTQRGKQQGVAGEAAVGVPEDQTQEGRVHHTVSLVCADRGVAPPRMAYQPCPTSGRVLGVSAACISVGFQPMLLQIVAKLTVRAHPRSSRRRLRWDGQTLEAWVTEPAAGNAANLAVISAIAEWLNVPRSAVRLLAGHRSRAKLVEVEGLPKLPPAG
jgi:uncharacterized protein